MPKAKELPLHLQLLEDGRHEPEALSALADLLTDQQDAATTLEVLRRAISGDEFIARALRPQCRRNIKRLLIKHKLAADGDLDSLTMKEFERLAELNRYALRDYDSGLGESSRTQVMALMRGLGLKWKKGQ